MNDVQLNLANKQSPKVMLYVDAYGRLHVSYSTHEQVKKTEMQQCTTVKTKWDGRFFEALIASDL